MPRGLHGVISGILAGDPGFSVLFTRSNSIFNSLAHKLPLWCRARPPLRGVFCWFLFLCFVFFGFCGWLFCLVFWLAFSSVGHPLIGHVGLCTGPRSLSTP